MNTVSNVIAGQGLGVVTDTLVERTQALQELQKALQPIVVAREGGKAVGQTEIDALREAVGQVSAAFDLDLVVDMYAIQLEPELATQIQGNLRYALESLEVLSLPSLPNNIVAEHKDGLINLGETLREECTYYVAQLCYDLGVDPMTVPESSIKTIGKYKAALTKLSTGKFDEQFLVSETDLPMVRYFGTNLLQQALKEVEPLQVDVGLINMALANLRTIHAGKEEARSIKRDCTELVGRVLGEGNIAHPDQGGIFIRNLPQGHPFFNTDINYQPYPLIVKLQKLHEKRAELVKNHESARQALKTSQNIADVRKGQARFFEKAMRWAQEMHYKRTISTIRKQIRILDGTEIQPAEAAFCKWAEDKGFYRRNIYQVKQEEKQANQESSILLALKQALTQSHQDKNDMAKSVAVINDMMKLRTALQALAACSQSLDALARTDSSCASLAIRKKDLIDRVNDIRSRDLQPFKSKSQEGELDISIIADVVCSGIRAQAVEKSLRFYSEYITQTFDKIIKALRLEGQPRGYLYSMDTDLFQAARDVTDEELSDWAALEFAKDLSKTLDEQLKSGPILRTQKRVDIELNFKMVGVEYEGKVDQIFKPENFAISTSLPKYKAELFKGYLPDRTIDNIAHNGVVDLDRISNKIKLVLYVDPHSIKPEMLGNAVKGYANSLARSLGKHKKQTDKIVPIVHIECDVLYASDTTGK